MSSSVKGSSELFTKSVTFALPLELYPLACGECFASDKICFYANTISKDTEGRNCELERTHTGIAVRE